VTSPRLSIGLVGYGRFGKLLAGHLARHVPVSVFDTKREQRAVTSEKISRSSLREAAACPVVILAVPVSALRPLLLQIAPMLINNALVIDVCAVKAAPAEWMNAFLPPNVFLLGSHPLFGPKGGTSLRGQSIVLCPLRLPAQLMRRISALLRRRGLRVITMTPRAHDRAMAQSLLITQYVGRYLRVAGVKRSNLTTPTFNQLCNIIEVAKSDSCQMFDDLLKFNPYTDRVMKKLERAHRDFLSSTFRRKRARHNGVVGTPR